MSGSLSPREKKLAAALAAAKHAALAVQESDDGGSANLDCAFLDAQPGLTAAAVRRAAEAAGVSLGVRQRSRWWNGWFVHVTSGQGAMRTRMAEAAAKALKEAGESATVYYKVDRRMAPRLRPADLSPAARARLPKPAPRKARVLTLPTPEHRAGAGWFECGTCGAEHRAWGGVNGAEAHAREQGHPTQRWLWATEEGA